MDFLIQRLDFARVVGRAIRDCSLSNGYSGRNWALYVISCCLGLSSHLCRYLLRLALHSDFHLLMMKHALQLIEVLVDFLDYLALSWATRARISMPRLN